MSQGTDDEMLMLLETVCLYDRNVQLELQDSHENATQNRSLDGHGKAGGAPARTGDGLPDALGIR